MKMWMTAEPKLRWVEAVARGAKAALVRDRIARLERFEPAIVGCRVVLAMPQRRPVKGQGVEVRIHLELPGPDIDLVREVRHGHVGADTVLAVNTAFAALERRLKEHGRKLGRQEVKHHAPVLHGELVELEPELGWGLVRADDGREVYVQKDALGAAAWAQLKPGDRLRFREQEGEKGAFAVNVSPA